MKSLLFDAAYPIRPTELPYQINVETTTFCNARCTFCCRDKITPALMDDDTFAIVVREIKDAAARFKCLRTIGMNGFGEPLLDPKIFERCRMVRDVFKGRIFFVSNGSLINPEAATKLRDCGLTDITVSYEGYSRETYEAQRVGLKFDQVKQNLIWALARWKDKGPAIDLAVVVDPNDGYNYREFCDYWKALGVRRIYLNKKHNWSGTLERGAGTQDCCAMSWRQVKINVNGQVNPCCVDWGNKLDKGHIAAGLWNIYSGEGYTLFRNYLHQGHLIRPCDGCTWRGQHTILKAARDIIRRALKGRPVGRYW